MFESESRDIGFSDVSLKTLLVLTHRRIFRTCHARVLGGFQQSSSPHCCVLQQFASNRAWAAVLATTAVLRAVAWNQTSSASKREDPANRSRLQSISSSSSMHVAIQHIRERHSLKHSSASSAPFAPATFFVTCCRDQAR